MADSTQFQVRLVTPDRVLVDAPAGAVELPGRTGYLEALPGAAPLLTELGAGEVRILGVAGGAGGAGGASSGEQRFHVAWGFAEILPDRVTILAENAQRPEEIDKARAEQQLKDGETLWNEAGEDAEAYTHANEVIAEAESLIESAGIHVTK